MYTKSTIAAGNIVVGVYNFVVLSHPDNWRIVPLPASSESFSFTRQGDVKWVSRGVAEHGIRTPQGIIGLKIEVWPGRRDRVSFKELRNASERGRVRFGAHEAKAYVYTKKGFFTSSRILALLVYCEYTDRSLLIEFIGGGEWVDEVLEYVGGSECHVEDQGS
jgi:hypothetical protein